MKKINQCAEPLAPIEKCLNCGKNVHTCERKIPINNSYLCPVHQNGFESSEGSWFCGEECYRKTTGEE